MKLKNTTEKFTGFSSMTNTIEESFGDNIKVASNIKKGKWFTTVTYNNTYDLCGIAESASMMDGELTVAINHGRRHLVFRYTADGENDINRISKILMPHHPMELYVCPRDKNSIMIKHKAIPTIVPIIDEIVYKNNVVSFHVGSAAEEHHIGAESGQINSEKYINSLYKISVDLSEKIIEVDDVIWKKIISSERLYKESLLCDE